MDWFPTLQTVGPHLQQLSYIPSLGTNMNTHFPKSAFVCLLYGPCYFSCRPLLSFGFLLICRAGFPRGNFCLFCNFFTAIPGSSPPQQIHVFVSVVMLVPLKAESITLKWTSVSYLRGRRQCLETFWSAQLVWGCSWCVVVRDQCCH